VEGVFKVGSPFEQILAVAAQEGCDLVVLGTHGRRGIAHAALGSVAEKVVRLCPVPVLTVHAAPEPGP
jgi:nucleotide-binding universal stress UspA family protein